MTNYFMLENIHPQASGTARGLIASDKRRQKEGFKFSQRAIDAADGIRSAAERIEEAERQSGKIHNLELLFYDGNSETDVIPFQINYSDVSKFSAEEYKQFKSGARVVNTSEGTYGRNSHKTKKLENIPSGAIEARYELRK